MKTFLAPCALLSGVLEHFFNYPAAQTHSPAPTVQWSMKAIVLSGALGERIRGVLRGTFRDGSEAHRGRVHGRYGGRFTFFIDHCTVGAGGVCQSVRPSPFSERKGAVTNDTLCGERRDSVRKRTLRNRPAGKASEDRHYLRPWPQGVRGMAEAGFCWTELLSCVWCV